MYGITVADAVTVLIVCSFQGNTNDRLMRHLFAMKDQDTVDTLS